MNYRHVYMLIIEHAKSEMHCGNRPQIKSQKSRFPNQYFEFHHILPVSLFPLWKSKTENIVCLTAREHFFCHQLLTKIWPSHQMFKALSIFCKFKQDKRQLTSKQYEECRKAAKIANVLWWSNPENKSRASLNSKLNKKPLSEKTKKRLSKINSERSSNSRWYNNGEIEKFTQEKPEGFIEGRLPLTEEQKLKRRATLRHNRENRTEEEKQREFERRSKTSKEVAARKPKKVNIKKEACDWNACQKKLSELYKNSDKSLSYNEFVKIHKKEVIVASISNF